MAFLSGSVSFSRFHVLGGSPKRMDDNLLGKFREHRIGLQQMMYADYEEIGWLGGGHILDLEFDLEKNIILDNLHFGMRIDASRMPPDLMRAYVQMELDALRDNNGNSRVNARMRREAANAAKRRADRELRDGQYCKLRQFPMLWDTRDDILYVGATQPAVLERLHPLFKTTFNKRLEQITAGYKALMLAEARGEDRKIESLRPSRFVEFPDDGGVAEVYWTAHDAASRDYLGNEFLLWLWYTLTNDSDTIELTDGTEAAVMFAKQLMLECPRAETGKQVITFDGPTQLPESRRAIRSGKLPRKAGLIVQRQGAQYEFTLQAETFNVSSAKLPKIELSPAGEGNGNGNGNGNGFGRARIEERVEQVRHLAETIDRLFETFLHRRLSSEWKTVLERISSWLQTA